MKKKRKKKTMFTSHSITWGRGHPLHYNISHDKYQTFTFHYMDDNVQDNWLLKFDLLVKARFNYHLYFKIC